MLAIPSRIELRHHALETQRLQLTPIDVRDAHDLWFGVDSSRAQLEPWLAWVAYNVDQAASYRYAEASTMDWDAGRALRFAIRDRATRRFLGVVGLEALSHMHQSCELGYWLRTDASGKGIMTEAARACVAWAFSSVKAHRVRVAVATDNHASLAVLRRLGYRFEGVARHAERVSGRWLDHALFAVLATD